MIHIPPNMPRPTQNTMEICDALLRAGVSYSEVASSMKIRTRTFRTLVWIWRRGNRDYLPTTGGPTLSNEVRKRVLRGGVLRSRKMKINVN